MPLFKSLLIVERGETCIPAKNLVKDILRIWFNDEANIWHWKGPEDKIIIVYPSSNLEDEEIRPLETSGFNFSRTDHIGYIKLYCNGNNIKVYNFKFSTSQQTTEGFRMLKKYCIATIRKLRLSEADIDQCGFHIHWDLPGATDFLKSISFINTGDNIYKFSGKEVGTGGSSWPQFNTQVANLSFSAFSQTKPKAQQPSPFSMAFGTQQPTAVQPTPQTLGLFQQTAQDTFKGFGTTTTPVKKDIFGTSQLGGGNTSLFQGFNFNAGSTQPKTVWDFGAK